MQVSGDSSYITPLNPLHYNLANSKYQSNSTTTSLSIKQESDFKGWLYKWTNYIKGSQSEMVHTCRGSISLQGAFIDTVDSTSFVITNGGTQTFHLKATSEVERQRWVTALELAKAKAIREMESDEDDENDDLVVVGHAPHYSPSLHTHPLSTPYNSYNSGISSKEPSTVTHNNITSSNLVLNHTLNNSPNIVSGNGVNCNLSESSGSSNNIMRALVVKLEDLATCDDLVNKHGAALQKALNELESAIAEISARHSEDGGAANIGLSQEKDISLPAKIKAVNERATLFRITANAIINACAEYLDLAQAQGKRWQRTIQHERDQKASLEEMVEQLAKQHSHLEKVAARNMVMISNPATNPSSTGKDNEINTNNPGGVSQAVSDEDEFFDATDVSAAAAANLVSDEESFVVTLPRKCKSYHNRTPSGISNVSEGASHPNLMSGSARIGPGGNKNETNSNNSSEGNNAICGGSSESSDRDEQETQEATVVLTKDVNKIGHKTKAKSNTAENTSDSHLHSTPTDLVQNSPTGNKLLDYTILVDKALLAQLKKNAGHPRHRRTSVPAKPNTSLNLWSIIKNCIGKDLSKIPMPVNFSEPLSMLQRLTEDFEYSEILDRAAKIQDPTEQMCYVAAFTISSYSTTIYRTTKPFNPLLGETYECDRSDDMGWCMVAEQVSHHPPTAAFYTESAEWVCWQEFTMSSKFRGKYLNIIPLGIAHLEFKKSGNHYTWRKVTSTVHNIIVGKLWMEHSGEMDIINHKTKDNCHLKYYSYSYFAREAPRKVTGVVTDSAGNAHWVLSGTWDSTIECAKVVDSDTNNKGKPVLETLPSTMLWKVRTPPAQNEAMYYFTEFAIQLNEPEKGVAPTDSRNRPDQRYLEEGKWELANQMKVKLEDKQRAVRRKKEAEIEKAAMEGKPYKGYDPIWFKKQQDPYTGNLIHLYKGQYFEKKAEHDWSMCPDIYGID
ncbi:oxysterol-binding protein 1-like isoform X2 [Gordionus sp. m RMFG-2023]|uniref:oxysterol-binding protein 1-like isoform X2 n=1 Tax=Gordionus sp. m RMFG-2023 TaxID=3053472 RepID=UPI0031FD7436